MGKGASKTKVQGVGATDPRAAAGKVTEDSIEETKIAITEERT